MGANPVAELVLFKNISEKKSFISIKIILVKQNNERGESYKLFNHTRKKIDQKIKLP